MPKKIGRKIIRLEEVHSTNTYLKENIELIKHHGLVVISKMQTSGRGRLGREFISLPNNNVTFSVVLHTEFPIDKIHFYSLLAGIVVSRVIEKYVDNVKLKWPNDVLIRGKKVCGILIETFKSNEFKKSCLILGIGINTKGFIKDYPPKLQNVLTTIEEEMLRNSSRKNTIKNEKIFTELLEELENCIKIFTTSKKKKLSINNNLNHKLLFQEWLDRSKSIGVKVLFTNNNKKNNKKIKYKGTIEGLTQEGYLIIKSESGEIFTHMSGEIIEVE